ncbi:serine hydrolase domain-containing protein [Ornithinibacillus salinisoli]|uniref:Serine hydrolase domain-containing protein n=1 Tax=Ornithinibacillus salinisoli TaxID=1848459 RepID=A0ABW4W3K6_9BACI
MGNSLQDRIRDIQHNINFSGTTFIEGQNSVLESLSYGYANRAEKLKNNEHTRFGIASGCKIFTSVAVCQLIGEGKISLDTKILEYLDFNLPHFDNGVTIHHLLTHTSGIPDYFDEVVMDDFEELWMKQPMYHLRRLHDFLPLFQDSQMMFKPGDHFHYNNAGYILLGLVIEQVSGLKFTDYVEKHIFQKAGMLDSGYFALDSLPGNTALGYIENPNGTWRTNIYSLPVQGGADGGAFVTSKDMNRFWKALLNQDLLNETMTNLLLTPHVQEEDEEYYGYGIWISKRKNTIHRFHVMGYDPGVSFHSAFYPTYDVTLTVCANISQGAFDIMHGIEVELFK